MAFSVVPMADTLEYTDAVVTVIFFYDSQVVEEEEEEEEVGRTSSLVLVKS